MRRHFRHARRPIDPSCPSWCATDHAIDVDIDDGIRMHCRLIARDVEVIATDDLEHGTRTPTEVVIRATSCATADDARQLALAILAAGDYVADGVS